MAKHFMLRRGTRGAASLLGLYGYAGAGVPTLLGDTYDRRNGKTGNYVPEMYNATMRGQICPAGDVIPLFSVAPGGRYQFYFDSFRDEFTPGHPKPATARWHFTSDGTAAPVAVATNAGIQLKHLVGLYTTDTTYFALASDNRVWSSPDGVVWTQGSSLTGGPTFEQGRWGKLFDFAADVFLFNSFGLYRNAANDLIAWAPIPLLVGYDQGCYHDIAVDGTAIMVICQGTSAGTTYNIILRSTDGTTFTELRKVDQLLDTPGGGLTFDLEWRRIVPFDTGFCIYGANPFSGSFPYVLKSTDHGATFAMSPVTPTTYALNSVSGYPGAGRIVAPVALLSSDPPGYPKLHESADGIAFTPLTF